MTPHTIFRAVLAAALLLTCGTGCLSFSDAGLYQCNAPANAHCTDACWCELPDAQTVSGGAQLASVCGTSSHDVWAAGDGILHWDGARWTLFPAQAFMLSAYCPAPGIAWLVGANGTVMHCTAAEGCSTAQPLSGNLSAVSGRSDSDVYVGGDSVVAHFDGTSWTTYPPPSSPVWGIWSDPQGQTWAAALDGIHSEASNFALDIPTGAIVAITGVHQDGSPLLWATANSGGMFTVRGGQLDYQALQASVRTAWATGPHDIYVGGGGGLFHSRGLSFDTTSLALPDFGGQAISGLWGDGPGDVWAVTSGGHVMQFHP